MKTPISAAKRCLLASAASLLLALSSFGASAYRPLGIDTNSGNLDGLPAGATITNWTQIGTGTGSGGDVYSTSNNVLTGPTNYVKGLVVSNDMTIRSNLTVSGTIYGTSTGSAYSVSSSTSSNALAVGGTAAALILTNNDARVQTLSGTSVSNVSCYVTTLYLTNTSLFLNTNLEYTVPFQRVATNLACSSVAGGTGTLSRTGWYRLLGQWYYDGLSTAPYVMQSRIMTVPSGSSVSNRLASFTTSWTGFASEGNIPQLQVLAYLSTGDRVYFASRVVSASCNIKGDGYASNITWFAIEYLGN